MTLKAQQGSWDYEEINAMITNPNAFAPGTKMALFPGLPEAKQRADVIAFLRTKNDNPPPLPAGGRGEVQGGQGPAETPAPAASKDQAAQGERPVAPQDQATPPETRQPEATPQEQGPPQAATPPSAPEGRSAQPENMAPSPVGKPTPADSAAPQENRESQPQ